MNHAQPQAPPDVPTQNTENPEERLLELVNGQKVKFASAPNGDTTQEPGSKLRKLPLWGEHVSEDFLDF